jgi:hypothetical protein
VWNPVMTAGTTTGSKIISNMEIKVAIVTSMLSLTFSAKRIQLNSGLDAHPANRHLVFAGKLGVAFVMKTTSPGAAPRRREPTKSGLVVVRRRQPFVLTKGRFLREPSRRDCADVFSGTVCLVQKRTVGAVSL